MRKRLLTAFTAALSLFGLSTNVLAENFEVQPTQVTTISEVTADDALYDASAAEWKITYGKISGNTFTSPAISYDASSVGLVKFDASAYKNQVITKAVLEFHSYCTVSGKNSQIEVASIDGADIDLTTATWNSVNAAGATLASIYTSDVWVNDAGADLSADITDYFTSDEDKILTFGLYTLTAREQAISNIKLVLYTDEQATYSYTVKATDGTNELKVLAEGQDTEGAAITVAYPLYILGEDGTLYSTKANNKQYNYSFTLNSDAQVENIVYTAGATDVVFLAEGEDIDGAKVLSDGNASIRASNSKTGYNDEQDLKVATLPAGKYKMTVGVFDSGKTPSAVFSFVSGETALFDAAATSTNLTETTSEEFTLTGASNDIMLKAGGSSSSQKSIDYIYIQKTGDVVVTEPEYAVGKLTFSDLEGVSAGRIDAGTVYDGGDFTVTVNKGDASFREFNNVRYFELTSGSFTVKGANGKKLNRIVLTGNKGVLKADVGTLSGTTWTGDADSVVFTNSIFQSSITAITVGDFKEPTKDAANIAAAIALGKDAEVKLMLNGTNVTITHNGYAFIQDETGGLRVENKDLNLKAGTAVKGYICGKYANTNGIPTLVTTPNTADSKFESVDTTFVPAIATGSGLNTDKYVNQVVKLLGNMTVQDFDGGFIAIEYDNVNVIFADSLNVLPENYTFPEKVGSIVALVAPYGEIWPVSADSIVSADALKPIYISNIKGLKSMPSGVDVALNLAGAVVTVDEMASTTESDDPNQPAPFAEGTRTIIVEDTTGAVTLNADIAEALPKVFTGDSIALTGSLIATVNNYYGQISLYASAKTASSTIETAAAEVKPTVMTVADSKNEDNSNMLIQYADVTVNGTAGKYQVVQDGETINLVDVFNKMQYTEGDSAEMVLPEGNVNINGILSYDINNDAYEFWPISYEAAAKETVYKEITETEVFLPTEDNIAAAVAEGWVVDGGKRAKKSGNVDPATGELLESPKSFDGIALKKGNNAKMFQTNVTGVDEITAYAVTGSSTDTRVFVVTATPSDGGEAIVGTAESAPKVTAVVTLALDATKQYVIDYTGTETDGAGGDMALQGIKFTVAVPEAQEYRKWDFTAWSEETKNNIEADASKYIDAPAPAGTETGWRRYEKDGAEWTETDGLKDPYTIYWYGSLISEPTELKANGEVIAETAGLLFNGVSKLNNTVAIAMDYPSALSEYDGGSYLWLNGSGLQFTIPAVMPGQKVLMEVESHKDGNARGVSLSVNGTKIGEDATPSEGKVSYEWTIPTELGTDLVDVLVTSTSGCHIYLIEAGDADKISTGINEVNAEVKVENQNVYTINGVMVRKAGESLDGLAKGLYIVGGKKVVIK